MAILTADKNPHTDVWLNGHNVSDWTTRCRVPDKPGRIGLGWVDVIVGVQERGLIGARADAEGNLITRRKYGFVKWGPTN